MVEKLPNLELITDTRERGLIITPEVKDILPKISEVFDELNKNFDPEHKPEQLVRLKDSLFEYQSRYGGEKVQCSLLFDGQESKTSLITDEMLIVFAPFADSQPQSRPYKLYEYLVTQPTEGVLDKIEREQAKPNTWNQIIKSEITRRILKSLGKNIPVLTIFSPIDTRVYSPEEREMIKSGKFIPAAGLVNEAIDEATIILQNKLGQVVNIRKLHLSGASLGASNAIGAAEGLANIYDIESVNAQELIMGLNLPELIGRYAIKPFQLVGKASDAHISQDLINIEEPSSRKFVDKKGSEIFGMIRRTIQGAKWTYLRGLSADPEGLKESIETVLFRPDSGARLLVARASNSGVSDRTLEHLPQGVNTVIVSGKEGQRLGHIVNEHVVVANGVIATLGVLGLLKKESAKK